MLKYKISSSVFCFHWLKYSPWIKYEPFDTQITTSKHFPSYYKLNNKNINFLSNYTSYSGSIWYLFTKQTPALPKVIQSTNQIYFHFNGRSINLGIIWMQSSLSFSICSKRIFPLSRKFCVSCSLLPTIYLFTLI